MPKTVRALLAMFLFVLCCSESAFASLAVTPQLQEIPIERLVSNLQREIKEQPEQVQWRYALARLYSMTYARGSTNWSVLSSSSPDEQTPWVGYGLLANEPGGNPPDKGKHDTQKYLGLAIQAYRDLLQMDPNHLYSLLGLAWCLKEAGQVDGAITTYRRTHELAWNQERVVDHGMAGQSVTIESGTELLELLPKEGAEKERAEIEEHLKILGGKFTWVTPLIIPLEETGLSGLVKTDRAGHSEGVRFDLDGFGADDWQWITPKAGLLVWDPEGKGIITSGRQLFGNVTWWIFWDNGYQPLSLLDNNGDGQLSGEELAGLSIWQDINSDGISQPGEVKPVTEWGIVSLACQPTGQTGGFLSHSAGVTFSNGESRPTYDWVSRKLPSPKGAASPPPERGSRSQQLDLLKRLSSWLLPAPLRLSE